MTSTATKQTALNTLEAPLTFKERARLARLHQQEADNEHITRLQSFVDPEWAYRDRQDRVGSCRDS